MRCAQLMLVVITPGLFVLAGCGDGFLIAEVEGKVLVNGSPVEKIQIEFCPTKEGPRSLGITDAQGRFTLTASNGKSGALVGTHKVVLRDVGIMGDKFLGRSGEDVDMTAGRTPRVADEYADATITPLKKEVSPGKCVIDLEVKPCQKQQQFGLRER